MFVCETHILFYDIQYLTYRPAVVDHVDGLLHSIYGVDTDDVDYDDYLCNNNDTNNDTPGGISGVENDFPSTIQYGNNNISSIDTNGVIVMHLIYNSVALVTALDMISPSSGRSFVRLSSEPAPILSLSSKILRLASHCGCVCLEHVPIALLACSEIIPPLSSPSLSPVSSFLCSSSPGLYSCSSSSHTKCPSYIPFSCQILNLVFGSSITPITRCFTRHIYDILFLKFNTESFLSYSYDHIHDHGVVLLSRIQSYSSHLSIYELSPLLPIIQNMCPL